MLLASLPVHVMKAPVAAFVRESARAIKEITEGEFDMVSVGEEGTMTLRSIVSRNHQGFRMVWMKDDQPVSDIAFVGGKGIAIDHEARLVRDFSKETIESSTQNRTLPKEEEVQPGNISINFNSTDGLVIVANPGLENVRRWYAGSDELVTGDFGKGEGKRGYFEMERDAKTKLPRSFVSTIDGRTVTIRFKIKARKVGVQELQIPQSSYEGYAKAPLSRH